MPAALLEAAAPAYLTDTQWDQLGEDWLKQALAYTSCPCKGARGPVTWIRPDRSHHRTAADVGEGGSAYRLADYLDQHGRTHQIPPLGFWNAVAAHAHPADLATLGDAAGARGLYRDAAQLHKNAIASGDPAAADTLIAHLHVLHPPDRRPAAWVAAHVALDNPDAVAWLLGRLGEVGADEQLTSLAERLPAAGRFDQFMDIADHKERFRFGREPDAAPSAPWTWEDLT